MFTSTSVTKGLITYNRVIALLGIPHKSIGKFTKKSIFCLYPKNLKILVVYMDGPSPPKHFLYK